tara:strand:+ start:67656 stop:67850 length:195 start_codon:yes stop_codon:yes gene_type:complete
VTGFIPPDEPDQRREIAESMFQNGDWNFSVIAIRNFNSGTGANNWSLNLVTGGIQGAGQRRGAS